MNLEYEEIASNSITGKNAIGKKAEILTTDNRQLSGYIYVIDPVSNVIILIGKNEVPPHLHIIPAHSVKHFKLYQDDTEDVEMFKFDKPKCDDVLQKKIRLKQWLQTNYIDIVDDGDSLKYQDYLIISPPYEIEDCYCTNTIVLERIKNLIENMPKES